MLVLLFVLLSICGGLDAGIYKDNVLRFISHDSINKHDEAQYTDCHQLRYSGGYNETGIYTLYINASFSYQVRCEYTPDASFTVIQRRIYGNENFVRSYSDYVNGFGHPQGDFWLGLYIIYSLTNAGNTVLNVSMQTWDGHRGSVQYRLFRLLETVYYTLQIGGYKGTIPDDLSFNNGMPFATIDRPDKYNCAGNMLAGWWYNYCTYALPNGIYYNSGPYTPSGGYYNGIFWKDWAGYGYSMKFITMSVSHT